MDEMIKEVAVEEEVAVKKTAKKTPSKKNTTKKQSTENTKIVTENKPIKEYKPNDIIQCHSVFPGKFLFSGPKTKAVYPFEASGDICFIEYQDLLSAMFAKKKSIMAPYIVIDDEELLEGIHWQQVKKIYDDMYSANDLDALLYMPYKSFEKNFTKLPIGAKKRVMMAISSKVRSGEFSEMNKIRLVDEACSSNIAVLLSR